jgi:hypothetical protein
MTSTTATPCSRTHFAACGLVRELASRKDPLQQGWHALRWGCWGRTQGTQQSPPSECKGPSAAALVCNRLHGAGVVACTLDRSCACHRCPLPGRVFCFQRRWAFQERGRPLPGLACAPRWIAILLLRVHMACADLLDARRPIASAPPLELLDGEPEPAEPVARGTTRSPRCCTSSFTLYFTIQAPAMMVPTASIYPALPNAHGPGTLLLTFV